jgi:hypothetical protein
MDKAQFIIVGREGDWRVEHDGEFSIAYATKEAAFEAAVAPASTALHAGLEVLIRVPGQQSADETLLGQQETP